MTLSAADLLGEVLDPWSFLSLLVPAQLPVIGPADSHRERT